VTGDMTGFAAACYMRGVPFIQVPTTLLSQVDSSVGGKTGINHPLGKNMIGAFYQPQAVIADIGALRTLPPRELAAGVAEVIKTGVIADASFFDWIEANVDALNRCDPQALTHAVKRSCEIKASVVAADEREGGLRAILNFGHTFGHAIEAGLGYGEWLHGEAVGCGMVMAADLSVRVGMLDEASRARMRHHALTCFSTRFDIREVAHGLSSTIRKMIAPLTPTPLPEGERGRSSPLARAAEKGPGARANTSA